MEFGATPQLLSTFYFINFLLSNSINDEQKIFNPDDIAKYPNCQNGDLAKVTKQFSPSEESEGQKEVLPTFPETIYPLLPDFLRQITNYANSGEDADLLFAGLFGRYFRLSAQRVRNLWWRYRFPQSLSVRYRPSPGRTNSTPFSMAYRSNTPPSSDSISSLRFAV